MDGDFFVNKEREKLARLNARERSARFGMHLKQNFRILIWWTRRAIVGVTKFSAF